MLKLEQKALQRYPDFHQDISLVMLTRITMCDQSPGQGQTPGRAIISSLGQRDSSIYQSLCGCPRRGAIHHSIRCFPLPTRCIEGGLGGKGELQPPLS